MSTTTNGLAVRDDRAPVSVPAGALAIEAGQTSWTTMQAAALGQLGIADAPEGDKQVFLHVSQRTGLDPFARQIYMIGRNEKKSEKRGGQWVETWSVKYTIQTGIEGFRVIRGRAERAEGIRGILSRPVFYNGAGEEFKVWFFKNPPAAVELTYTVRDRNGNETPYTSILRYDEYVQTKKQTVNGTETFVPASQWATKPVHMLEKCTEADVYRKAFPQDFSGVHLDDAMPAAVDWDGMPDEELDRRARAVGYRDRVTAEQARARHPQTVTATVVTPDVPPAGEQATPVPAEAATPAPPAGGTQVTPDQVKALWSCLTRDYGFGSTGKEKDQAREAVSILADRSEPIGSVNDLTAAEASGVLDLLHGWVRDAKETGERPRDILAADIASRDAGPREDGEPGGE
jgi:phage recombination protein Bet